MPSLLDAQSAILSQNELVAGIIEHIIDVDQFFRVLDFKAIEGNAHQYTRESANVGDLGDVEFYNGMLARGAVNNATDQADITAKNPALFVSETTTLTTIVGDVEMDNLTAATRSTHTNQIAAQVASKAKQAGRTFQQALINGVQTDGRNFDGLLTLVSAAQTIAPIGGAAGPWSLRDLDRLLDMVKAKDGKVDYIMMHSRDRQLYMELLRSQGGANIDETANLPGNEQILAYRGVPIFRNEYIPTDLGGGTNESVIFAGTLDDGSESNGLQGITARDAMGLNVRYLGDSHVRDEQVHRITWYCGLVNYSDKGLAAITQIVT